MGIRLTENIDLYSINMLNELRAVREKYKLPKGFLFVPDKLEISITRRSYDNLHLSYKEYFNYLPEPVLNIIIPITINMMVQGFGIPNQQIERISKNAINTELNGSAAEITAFVLGELFIQKNFTENEIEKMVSMFKRTTKALTDSSNLEFEWNDKLEKEFFENLSELLAATQSNPLMRSEMQEIVNKYSQRIEKVRALIEKKNQSKDS